MLKLIFLLLVFLFVELSISANGRSTSMNPFRIAIVIGNQWDDPSSYFIKKTSTHNPGMNDMGYHSAETTTDFHHLVILLKTWGIPFDIVRLDQQLLDHYIFLNMDNTPKYGTIIWAVEQSDELQYTNYSIISDLVYKYGIGFIALSDRIKEPEIQEILGIKYLGSWQSGESIRLEGTHYITHNTSQNFELDPGIWGHIKRQQVELKDGTTCIAKQGKYPFVTVNELPFGTKSVWIGGDPNFQFYYSNLRKILRRAITWTIGYSLYKTFTNEVIMIMDDPGGSQNVYLDHWHHPALKEEEIREHLINPLLKHNAVLNINFVPGFVDEKQQRLLPTWQKQFIDDFGTAQDYISSKRGYEKGIELGVFEVMCHGLTHMQPDLFSEPGWYGAILDQEKAEVGWYREFGDLRRKKEIPAAEQLWRMNTAKDWLIEQFGKIPLQFCPGGRGVSESYHNNTSRLAGKAGFGWLGWRDGYLGTDLVITGWEFFGSESPLIVPSLPNGHNFGISYAPLKFEEIFKQYPSNRFISINEFIGYLHAQNASTWKNTNHLSLSVNYDTHYCQYFQNNESIWNLDFADWFMEEKGIPGIEVNGKGAVLKTNKLVIPQGCIQHRIDLKF